MIASYYADKYEGRMMANGRPFRQSAMTCASNRWPIGARLRVRFGEKTIVVIVTDRMAPGNDRIDLSKAAFKRLSPLTPGIISVGVTTVD